MPAFVDKKNRSWSLDLDVWLVEQIHQRVDGVRIDALLADHFAGLSKLFGDAILFVRVLWVMVEDQATKRGIAPEDFGRSLGGDSLEAAGDAFVQALADFTPRRQRTVLKALVAKGTEVLTEQTETALKKIAEWRAEPSPPATSVAGSSDSTLEAGG